MSGLRIEFVGGICPCQGYGDMDQYPFYFRARHGEWNLFVTVSNCDPVLACLGNAPLIYHEGGDDPTYGGMSPEQATTLIEQTYTRFHAEISRDLFPVSEQ